MSNEPREVQRLERLKQNANKYMKLIDENPDSSSLPIWENRLQDMLRGIEVLKHEVAVAILKQEEKQPGGVHIQVPAAHFALKPLVPGVTEE